MLLVTDTNIVFSFSEALISHLIKTGSLTNVCGTSAHPTRSSDGSFFGSRILDFCRYPIRRYFPAHFGQLLIPMSVHIFSTQVRRTSSLSVLETTNGYASSYFDGSLADADTQCFFQNVHIHWAKKENNLVNSLHRLCIIKAPPYWPVISAEMFISGDV